MIRRSLPTPPKRNATAATQTLKASHSRKPSLSTFFNKYANSLTDLFPVLVCCCPILIHACVIRKALVEVVGGFDTGLRTHEDWDFWQRIARTGARFGAVREVLTFYRMRPNSLSRDTNHIFAEGMRVVTQGHAPDPRVPNPYPSHVEGQPREALPKVRLGLSAWYAGFSLGRGEDARHLLKLLVNDRDPSLEPSGKWKSTGARVSNKPLCPPLSRLHGYSRQKTFNQISY